MGGTDRIEVPHSADIDFNGLTDEYTVACWFKSDDPTPGSNSVRMLEKGQSAGGTPYPFSWQILSSGDLDVLIFDGNVNTLATVGQNIWDDEWHFAVMVVSNENVRAYLDGVLAMSSPNVLQSNATDNTDLVFGNSIYTTQGMVGALDDIRIYSQQLTDCEIWSLFLEGTSAMSQTESFSICSGSDYTFPDGSTQPNIISQTIHTSYFPSLISGCDSAAIETILDVVPLPDVTVIESGATLTAQNVNDGVTYQWLDCDNDFEEIPDETNQVFNVSVNGSYAVAVSENGCTDTSTCFTVTTIGIVENDFGNGLRVYPNPTDGNFSVDLGTTYNDIQITLTDLSGRHLQSIKYNNGHLLNLELNEPAGFYLLFIESENKRSVIRLIKE